MMAVSSFKQENSLELSKETSSYMLFGRFRAKKEELPEDVERIHVGKESPSQPPLAAAPPQLDILGYSNDEKKAYGIYSKDRVHIGLFGETGAGKSVTIGGLVYQNIARNEGFMIIDPHGDLSRETLAAIPEHLKDKVIYIGAMSATPQWFGKAIKINPLECKDPKDRNVVAMTFVNALKNMYQRNWGDRLEAILRNSVNALVEIEGTTLWDLSRIVSSPKYLAQVIRTIGSQSTINFLQNVMPAYKRDAGSAAYNKLDKILTTPLVATMFDTVKSSFDMGQAMNDGMFIIADLSSGMSDDVADFVGSILLNMLYVEAMRRVDVERIDRKPFYLYIDEAHRFSPAELQSLLTTVRKFNVKVTIASQTINNFPTEIQKSFSALCKTIILFKSDIATAKMFETMMPLSSDEITSLSLNTFAFYSQAQPPITGIATTKLVLEKHSVANWKERARYSVERFGSEANLDKYMPSKKKGHVPNWMPIDIKVVYLLRTHKMTRTRILDELVARYGNDSVDSEAVAKSIEALRLDHVIIRKYQDVIDDDGGGSSSSGNNNNNTEREEIIDLDYSAYNRFFDTRMIGNRTGKEKHKATIIYLAEKYWNALRYCKIDLGNAHEQLADILVVDEVQFTDSDGKKKYDLQTWGDATAIEIETDPQHREEQVVRNYDKNHEQGFNVHFMVFDSKDKDAIRRFLTEKRGIEEDTYKISIIDLAEIERFRNEKLGVMIMGGGGEVQNSDDDVGKEGEGEETISGTGGISPEEMRVIRQMRSRSRSSNSNGEKSLPLTSSKQKDEKIKTSLLPPQTISPIPSSPPVIDKSTITAEEEHQEQKQEKLTSYLVSQEVKTTTTDTTITKTVVSSSLPTIIPIKEKETISLHNSDDHSVATDNDEDNNNKKEEENIPPLFLTLTDEFLMMILKIVPFTPQAGHARKVLESRGYEVRRKKAGYLVLKAKNKKN